MAGLRFFIDERLGVQTGSAIRLVEWPRRPSPNIDQGDKPSRASNADAASTSNSTSSTS